MSKIKTKTKNKNGNNNNNIKLRHDSDDYTEIENPGKIYFEDPQMRVYAQDTILLKTYIMVHKPHLELLKRLCDIGYVHLINSFCLCI